MTSTDISSDTPSQCTADFSLIPIGSQSSSFSKTVTAIQQLIHESGLRYHTHTTGTTIEGEWDEVMRVIGVAHTLVHHAGISRIQTDLRILTRTDKKESIKADFKSDAGNIPNAS